MSKCPNCFYELVLLEKRRKYKCAKCGRLWNQKEIETKDFVEFNKREREKDWKEIHKGSNREPPLDKEEARRKNLEAHKIWYQKNRDKIPKARL